MNLRLSIAEQKVELIFDQLQNNLLNYLFERYTRKFRIFSEFIRCSQSQKTNTLIPMHSVLQNKMIQANQKRSMGSSREIERKSQPIVAYTVMVQLTHIVNNSSSFSC